MIKPNLIRPLTEITELQNDGGRERVHWLGHSLSLSSVQLSAVRPGAPGLAVFETREDDMEVREGVALNRSFSFAALICLLRLKAARSRTEGDSQVSKSARPGPPGGVTILPH